MAARLRLPVFGLAAISWAAILLTAQSAQWISAPRTVAPGVQYYTSMDTTLVGSEGPIAVYMLRLDASQVRLASVLSNDEVVDAETVAGIAARHHAVAAINAGFFNTRNGEPAGLLKVAGELVSDIGVTKGAVAIRSPARGKTQLDFDQISARVVMTFKTASGDHTVPVNGVDTTRERGKLMLYTPAYHIDTDTAPNGTEWVLNGNPLKIIEVRRDQGHTPIPRTGSVLSYGGLDLPSDLAALVPNTEVRFQTIWTSVQGLQPGILEQADHIVNGNGLLRVKGRTISEWRVERFSADFPLTRHPRTLIGVDQTGAIWLIAVDGRQPEHSIGMTFDELQRLCDRLHLTDALNLDGGGSTTMVVKDQIVNRPSDATGPRPVSDALLVTVR